MVGLLPVSPGHGHSPGLLSYVPGTSIGGGPRQHITRTGNSVGPVSRGANRRALHIHVRPVCEAGPDVWGVAQARCCSVARRVAAARVLTPSLPKIALVWAA